MWRNMGTCVSMYMLGRCGGMPLKAQVYPHLTLEDDPPY